MGTPVDVLVSFGLSNKVLRLNEGDDINKKVADAFNLGTSKLILQRYDQDWEQYVDFEVTEETPVRHKDKLKCLQISTPVSIASSSENDGFVDNISQCSSSGSSLDLSPIASTSSCSSSVDSSNFKQWPLVYSLPTENFSQTLQVALKSKKDLSWSLKHEFVQMVTTSILEYTYYPTSAQLQEVGLCIIRTFPYLRETIGSGYDGWKESVRNQLKNFRRKCSAPEVTVRKSKRKLTEVQSPGETPREKVSNESSANRQTYSARGINWAPSVCDENVVDYKKKAGILRDEMKKVLRDKKLVTDLMEETYAFRRSFINAGPSIADIISSYPALQENQEVQHEMKRLMGNDCRDAFMENVHKYGIALISLAKERKKKSSHMTLVLRELKEKLESDPNILGRDVHYNQSIAGLRLLPDLLDEDFAEFLTVVPESTDKESLKKTGAPVLIVVGDFHSRNCTCYITGEREFLSDSDDVVESIYLLMSYFFILNIKYKKEVQNTFCLIENFFHLKCTKPTRKTISLMEKLKKTTKM